MNHAMRTMYVFIDLSLLLMIELHQSGMTNVVLWYVCNIEGVNLLQFSDNRVLTEGAKAFAKILPNCETLAVLKVHTCILSVAQNA